MVINSYHILAVVDGKPRYEMMISDGIWTGIIDTKEKADTLPKLERFLNSVVSDDDYFAFRDDFTAGYMMVHKGNICEKGPNSFAYEARCPEELYEYYKRRETIPTKIIYMKQWGKDNSLTDSTYQYNKFLNQYYMCTPTDYQDSIFESVTIYNYNGGFDGNYDYWIDDGIQAYYRTVERD